MSLLTKNKEKGSSKAKLKDKEMKKKGTFLVQISRTCIVAFKTNVWTVISVQQKRQASDRKWASWSEKKFLATGRICSFSTGGKTASDLEAKWQKEEEQRRKKEEEERKAEEERKRKEEEERLAEERRIKVEEERKVSCHTSHPQIV